MSPKNNTVTIFWSWQSESPREHRNFISDCINRAVKQLGKNSSVIFDIDRDTAGVPGMPSVADTILSKIALADVFIWDATLVYELPRPAPNPNVLYELGYAMAILGEGRMIGVMNTANGRTPEKLPFDLVHRRWPFTYSLSPPPDEHLIVADKSKILLLLSRLWRIKKVEEQTLTTALTQEEYQAKKLAVRQELVKGLAEAIKNAIAAPRTGAVKNDVDLVSAHTLWQIIRSSWIKNWYDDRSCHLMYEEDLYLDVFDDYVRMAKLPENQFQNPTLKSLHEELTNAITAYHLDVAREMIPMDNNYDRYVITCRTRGWYANYDQDSDRQTKVIDVGSERVWQAWQAYVAELRGRYPEVIST